MAPAKPPHEVHYFDAFMADWPTGQAPSPPRSRPVLPLPAMEQARLGLLRTGHDDDGPGSARPGAQSPWPAYPEPREPLGRLEENPDNWEPRFAPDNPLSDWPKTARRYTNASHRSHTQTPSGPPELMAWLQAPVYPSAPEPMSWMASSDLAQRYVGPTRATPQSPHYQWEVAPHYTGTAPVFSDWIGYNQNLEFLTPRYSPRLPFPPRSSGRAYGPSFYSSPAFS